MWDKIKKAFKAAYTWLLRYPVALLITILVVAGAAILMLFGVGDRFNVGGLIGKLFGRDDTDEKSEVEVANEVDPDRTDSEGNAIPLEEPDEHGWTQQEVDVIETGSNPFRDKSKVTVKTSEGGEKKLRLPTGVEDKDVKRIIEIKPDRFKVEVKKAPNAVDEELIDYLRS
jgi:hypothetical protein